LNIWSRTPFWSSEIQENKNEKQSINRKLDIKTRKKLLRKSSTEVVCVTKALNAGR
jgi:hypothetical protein